VSKVDVLIQRLDPELPLPSYAHAGDAGADLVAAEDVELAPGERAVVPTGVAIALPDGYAAFIHPRSGLGAKLGVTIVNAPGTVDAGYRGEIKVTLLNTDKRDTVRLQRGDRIAQMVVQRVEPGASGPQAGSSRKPVPTRKSAGERESCFGAVVRRTRSPLRTSR
jgi:dUTP pyrophosphatase